MKERDGRQHTPCEIIKNGPRVGGWDGARYMIFGGMEAKTEKNGTKLNINIRTNLLIVNENRE
jgi:hypothetical protein